MSDYTIDDILDFTSANSPTKVQDAVNAVLGAKSVEALQGIKSSLAQSLYAEEGPEDEETFEDLEDEEIELEDDDETDFDEDDFDDEDLEVDEDDIDWDEDELDLDVDLEGLEDNE